MGSLYAHFTLGHNLRVTLSVLPCTRSCLSPVAHQWSQASSTHASRPGTRFPSGPSTRAPSSRASSPPVSAAPSRFTSPTVGGERTPRRSSPFSPHRRMAVDSPPANLPPPAFMPPVLLPSHRPASHAQRPVSPSVAEDQNFILPTDVDAEGNLLATVTSFPSHALKIMHNRWRQHLPLDSLTPDAIKDAQRRPQADVAFARPNNDGTFAFVTRDLDDRGEYNLSESELRQAYPNLLRLVHYHCSRSSKDRIVRGLQRHYAWMAAQPDYFSDFVLYLRYDIEIRKLIASMTNYVPKDVEVHIFKNVEKQYSQDLSRGRIQNPKGGSAPRPRSRSASPRRSSRGNSYRPSYGSGGRSPRPSSSRPRPYESRGQSFRANSSTAFCIVCGQSGHSSTACTTSSAPYLVLEKSSNRWLAPGGNQFCYRWNNNSQSCKQCHREHRCTLCGDKGHNARACSCAAS